MIFIFNTMKDFDKNLTFTNHLCAIYKYMIKFKDSSKSYIVNPKVNHIFHFFQPNIFHPILANEF